MRCPKCSGRHMYKESDRFGAYTTCAFCGWSSDVATVPSEISRTVSSMLEGEDGKQRFRQPSMARLR